MLAFPGKDITERSSNCLEVVAKGFVTQHVLVNPEEEPPHAPAPCLGHAQYITSEVETHTREQGPVRLSNSTANLIT